MKKKIYFILFIVFVLILLLIIGYFVFYEDSREIILDKEEVANKESEVEKKIDTSDWVTYKNEEYGFSLKYPEGWEKNEVDNTRILLRNVYKEFSPQTRIEGELIIELFKDDSNVNLDEWININRKLDEDIEQKSKKKIKIGSENTIERVIVLNHDEVEYREIFLKKNNYIYNIHPNVIARFPDKEIEKNYKHLIDKGEEEIQLILESMNFN